ncbi:TIGR02444 family protein [Photobacterium sp. WH77]|uniref:TIGR02444 family protein n=1 Tax=Photobacterium arenosum TaxID=2774143 RepID=A0ABR9BKW2_9GAMM|nr:MULTISPECIES: TIGR02444 family protein [Photobacterium]MBD8513190.1 TIGR02444 family protein [Photobacterium arenosum]MBV7262103.1 TIGR02444 family protein [Photobacterium sp. WH24]MCG2837035.1 TIGR02444 family protein [Photobacterium sp. WH77]MCG2844815.1 TIGR02444 family protein [Photobacterium sp. WH80]MDO6580814.1 TIGR02444 family protein [Photobacterium sp. 2_MG-2023]
MSNSEHTTRQPFQPDQFWRFCLQHYSLGGVSQACLQLQDDFRGNVNLALLLLWLDSQQYSLSETEIRQLDKALAASDSQLKAYRQLRRALKPQLDQPGYQQMLDFELLLEQSQQQDLIRCLNHQAQQARAALPPPADNLGQYCQHLNAASLTAAIRG